MTVLPLLSLSGPLKIDEAAGHQLRLDRRRPVLRASSPTIGAVRRDLDEAFLEAAAKKFGHRLAGREHLHEARIEHFPVPLGAGQIGLAARAPPGWRDSRRP